MPWRVPEAPVIPRRVPVALAEEVAERQLLQILRWNVRELHTCKLAGSNNVIADQAHLVSQSPAAAILKSNPAGAPRIPS
jgi:hypothetical protein